MRSTYNIRVARSTSITGPFTDGAGEDMMLGGGSLFLTTARQFHRPRPRGGSIPEGSTNWLSRHFYDGTREA